MGTDLEQFREMTRQARLDAKKTAEEARKRTIEKEQMKQEAEALKAQQVILQIPDRMTTEARAGRGHAILMSIDYSDYKRPRESRNSWNVCEPEWLIGACKLVYDYCVEDGLKPTIESWHDGVGINSGFNIVIHWL